MKKWQDDRENATLKQTTVEQILAIFLTDTRLFREHMNELDADLFGHYRWIYQTMKRLDETDELTFQTMIYEHLDHAALFHQLRNQFISVGRLPNLIQTLKNEHVRDEMLHLSMSISADIYSDEKDIIDIVSGVRDRLDKISENRAHVANPEKDAQAFVDWYIQAMDDPSQLSGMMTGLTELDRLTNGYQRTDFIVVGARTSMGKSAFMLDQVLRLDRCGYKTAIFSLEMSKRQIYLRMLANINTWPLKTLKAGLLSRAYLQQLEASKERLQGIYVDDTRGIDTEYIADTMPHLKRTQGLDFVVVDYIQDVKEKGEANDNQGSAIARICRNLRKAAQQCDCAVMGLSQIGRSAESRQDKRPMLSELSGSTGIETSADAIMLLHREDYYDPETTKKNVLEVNVAKQRNGETGRIELYYDREHQRILPPRT
jgi:replicative DNA helicase